MRSMHPSSVQHLLFSKKTHNMSVDFNLSAHEQDTIHLGFKKTAILGHQRSPFQELCMLTHAILILAHSHTAKRHSHIALQGIYHPFAFQMHGQGNHGGCFDRLDDKVFTMFVSDMHDAGSIGTLVNIPQYLIIHCEFGFIIDKINVPYTKR